MTNDLNIEGKVQLTENQTEITCSGTNGCSIIYSANKNYGCDSSNWNALY